MTNTVNIDMDALYNMLYLDRVEAELVQNNQFKCRCSCIIDISEVIRCKKCDTEICLYCSYQEVDDGYNLIEYCCHCK